MSAPLTFWLSKEKARITSSQLGPDRGHLESWETVDTWSPSQASQWWIAPAWTYLSWKDRQPPPPAGLCARLLETELPGRKARVRGIRTPAINAASSDTWWSGRRRRGPENIPFWNMREKTTAEDVIRRWYLSSALTQDEELSRGTESALPSPVSAE